MPIPLLRLRRYERGRTLALFAGVAFVIAVAAAAWLLPSLQSDERAADSTPAAVASSQATVPVFIYLIDTLRADRLQPYGYGKATSPQINALAAASVLFEQAYAPAPWTLPSVTSLFTSTYACEHGVTVPEMKLAPALKTLAQRMKAIGYSTGAYYGNIVVGPVSGLDRGYDVSVWHEDDIREGDVRAFLDRIGGATPFLYLHTMEPHQPYLADYKYIQPFGHVPIDRKVKIDDIWTTVARLKRIGTAGRNPHGTGDATTRLNENFASLDAMRDSYEVLYDASVLQADDNLGHVIDVLKSRKLWDKALFIVMADHGEEFGEHGIWFHEESMYDAVTHVPLLIHFPGGQHAGERVSQSVSLVDVMPTILDYLGRPDLCDGCRGMSLMGLLRGERGRDKEAFVTGIRVNQATYHRPWRERRGDINVAVRSGQYKGIWNEQPQTIELYDIAADSAEEHDLSAGNRSLAEQLRSDAVAWLRDCRSALKAPEEAPLDERTQERLQSLGYAR